MPVCVAFRVKKARQERISKMKSLTVNVKSKLLPATKEAQRIH